jgi:hypothetical protein
MVDKPNKQTIPPAAAPGVVKMPKIEGPQNAVEASASPKYSAGFGTPNNKEPRKEDLANKDRNATFKLPEKVSAKDIHDQSFKYGGGRSAGNRSIQANKDRKENEQ